MENAHHSKFAPRFSAMRKRGFRSAITNRFALSLHSVGAHLTIAEKLRLMKEMEKRNKARWKEFAAQQAVGKKK